MKTYGQEPQSRLVDPVQLKIRPCLSHKKTELDLAPKNKTKTKQNK